MEQLGEKMLDLRAAEEHRSVPQAQSREREKGTKDMREAEQMRANGMSQKPERILKRRGDQMHSLCNVAELMLFGGP